MTRGTLADGEPHPASASAADFLRAIPTADLFAWREVFASNAISGNRLAEVCGETLDRILRGDPVSDRYLLGLAWMMSRAGAKKKAKKRKDGAK